MSIILKGINMPKSCKECLSECINIAVDCVPNYEEEAKKNCPLVEIPTPHGRLIDEQKVLLTNLEIFMCEGDYKEALKLICEKLDDAPTILEGER